MQSEIFKLKAVTGEQFMSQVLHTLRAVDGVSDVTVSLPRSEVSVQFNEQFASRQGLQAVLLGAGYGVETTKPAHGTNGGCCGGCGG